MTTEQAMSPKQAAELLNVGANALKKYSLLLEQAGYQVRRNEKNHRIYAPDDVEIIRAMLILNRIKGVHLDEAASKVTSSDADIALILSYDDTYTDAHNAVSTVTGSHVAVIAPQVAEYITALQEELRARDVLHIEFVASIDDRMNEQAATTKRILAQNEALMAKVEELSKSLEAESKRSIWSRLIGK